MSQLIFIHDDGTKEILSKPNVSNDTIVGWNLYLMEDIIQKAQEMGYSKEDIQDINIETLKNINDHNSLQWAFIEDTIEKYMKNKG